MSLVTLVVLYVGLSSAALAAIYWLIGRSHSLEFEETVGEVVEDLLRVVEENTVFVKIKLLHPAAKIPKRAKPGDAGADLYAVEDTELTAGEWKLIRCGFAMELPPGYEAQVRPRSGLALKNGITVLNTPGTVDCAFRGELGVLLINHGPRFIVHAGDRIAQLVVKRVPVVVFHEADELSDSERGKGGFGSTGVRS